VAVLRRICIGRMRSIAVHVLAVCRMCLDRLTRSEPWHDTARAGSGRLRVRRSVEAGIAGLSERDRETLRRIECDLRTEEPDLAERLESFGRPVGFRPLFHHNWWWDVATLGVAVLIAFVSMAVTFAW